MPATLRGDAVMTPHVKAKSFLWVSRTGSAGQTAVVQCPTGYRLIGGASSSVDGSAVGIGWANPSTNTWHVRPSKSTAQAIAGASCVSNANVPKSVFRWLERSAAGGIASVQCPSGFIVVSGYARVTAAGEQITKTYLQGNNAFFVTGGANAGASCGRGAAGIASFTKWNSNQNPKQVYSPCSTGFSVIGGNTGSQQWPGPPIQQHRGTSTPGVVGNAGWWVLASGENVVSYAICVPNGT